jgi:hypothetical protein
MKIKILTNIPKYNTLNTTFTFISHKTIFLLKKKPSKNIDGGVSKPASIDTRLISHSCVWGIREGDVACLPKNLSSNLLLLLFLTRKVN